MNIQENITALLAQEIKDYDEDNQEVKVTMHEGSDLFDLDYHTMWAFDYSQAHGPFPIFYIISQPEYAGRINQIAITGEDEGVNGTQDWDLKTLLGSEATFDNLVSFILPLNDEDNHHRKIVTNNDSYDENGALGLLLNKCKNLNKLISPSAPGPLFFEREAHGLTDLVLQTGYDHQNFISNLAKSTCFKELSSLTFRDYAETYMDDYKNSCTKFEDYLALVNSDNLPALKHIVLIDTVLDEEQKSALIKAGEAKGRVVEFRDIDA